MIADIYRPSKNGEMARRSTFPVILVRTCDDKDAPIKFFAGPDYQVTPTVEKRKVRSSSNPRFAR